MKKIRFGLLLPVALICSSHMAAAQPASNSVAPPATKAPALSPEERDKATHEKHTRAIMDALKLDDAAQAAKVHDIVVAYFADWKAWHAKNDAQLKELWVEYGKARNTKNQTNIDNAMAQIDAVYVAFKPQHDAYIAKLATVLNPAQIETMEDAITIKKV